MKRLLICLILLMLPCVALANEWGVPDETVELFEGNDDYTGYTCLAAVYNPDTDTAALVMGNGSHNQLVCARWATFTTRDLWLLEVSTPAVYQPGEEKADQVTLAPAEDGGFILEYPGERYEFAWNHLDEWYLWSAVLNQYGMWDAGPDVIRADYGPNAGTLVISDAFSSDAVWTLPGTLTPSPEEFNIRLFPRTVDEVRQLNALGAYILDLDCGLYPYPIEVPQDAVEPVYSAPSTDSWRAAEGKASVSLRDTKGLYTFGTYDGWQLIEYRISPDRSLVGYIQTPGGWENHDLTGVPVRATTDTYLTDDPRVSQRPLTAIPEGTELSALTTYYPFYAYVETALEGQTIRGFVPLRDLTRATCLPEGYVSIEDELVGAWYGLDDAEWAMGKYIMLGEFGSFIEYAVDPDWYPEDTDSISVPADALRPAYGGRWTLDPCPPGRFEDCEHLLTLTYEDETVDCLGVSLKDGRLLVQDFYDVTYIRVQPGEDEAEWDMMTEIAGTYQIFAGGSHFPGNFFTLNADGTLISYDEGLTGTWHLTRCNPADGHAWSSLPYALHVTLENGYSFVHGCQFDPDYDDGYNRGALLSLFGGEGSGSYMRLGNTPEEQQEALMEGLQYRMRGVYILDSGVPVLGTYVELLADGYFYADDRNDHAMAGVWTLAPRDPADASFAGSPAYVVTLRLADDSGLHPGETLRFGCDFAPETGRDPASVTFYDAEGSGVYVWRDAPGNS